jgi:hypothetical protein
MDLVPEIKIIVHREGETAEHVEPEQAEKKKGGGRKAKEEVAAEETPATAE